MKSWLAIAAFCSALLICTDTHGGLTMSTANAGEHVSLQSYPDAVLTATDPGSGITVSVEPNGTVLTASDGSGKQIWTLDVIKETGKPATGFPVIRFLEVTSPGTLAVVVGKSRSSEVDIKTGKAKLQGED